MDLNRWSKAVTAAAVLRGGGDGADWLMEVAGAQINGWLKWRDFRLLLFRNSIAARLLRRIDPVLPNPAAAGATAHGQRQQEYPGDRN